MLFQHINRRKHTLVGYIFCLNMSANGSYIISFVIFSVSSSDYEWKIYPLQTFHFWGMLSHNISSLLLSLWVIMEVQVKDRPTLLDLMLQSLAKISRDQICFSYLWNYERTHRKYSLKAILPCWENSVIRCCLYDLSFFTIKIKIDSLLLIKHIDLCHTSILYQVVFVITMEISFIDWILSFVFIIENQKAGIWCYVIVPNSWS